MAKNTVIIGPVEKGVPIPQVVKKPLYPFDIMAVGESFTVSRISLVYVKGLVSKANNTSRRKFMWATVPCSDSYRVWRTE